MKIWSELIAWYANRHHHKKTMMQILPTECASVSVPLGGRLEPPSRCELIPQPLATCMAVSPHDLVPLACCLSPSAAATAIYMHVGQNYHTFHSTKLKHTSSQLLSLLLRGIPKIAIRTFHDSIVVILLLFILPF